MFWIDVSSTSLAERSLLNLAQTLSLPAQTWEETCLAIANLKHPWLLVLDNADDPSVDYQPYIPNSHLGVVLMTSRNVDCQQYATTKPLHLEGLSADAARVLLLKAAHVPANQYSAHREDAVRVAALLQSHPLALIQAGTYILRGHCRLDQYPAVYERQRRRLLQVRPTQAQSRYRDVYATFEASADALKQSTATAAGDALELLPLLAVCDTSQLPLVVFRVGWAGARDVSPDTAEEVEDDEVALLTPWHVSRMPAFLNVGDKVWDSFRLVEAIQLLKAFALVSTEAADESMTLSMHPLVHAWARDRQNADERHAVWLSMGCVMAFARVAGLSRALDRQLQAHVESVVAWDVDTMFAGASLTLVTRVLICCGWLLHRMRSDGKLALLISRLLTHLGLDEKVVVQPWLGLFDLAGRNLDNCGKPRQAIGLLEQVVQIRSLSLSEHHPDRLASQHALAGAYEANGQLKEAVALLEEVVQIQAQSLATDHPSRLASQQALASAYRANGQVKEAVALSEEVVQIQAQVLAMDHPDRLASQCELARAYYVNGQVKEAVALLEEVVQIEAQVLAMDHPNRLTSERELARVYEANGQVKEAVALLEEVVQIEAQVLAMDHPNRLTSERELARVYEANGQVKEAVALLEQVVQIQAQSLATDHPSRLASQQALASAYRANGQVKEAVALSEEVVQIQAQVLAMDHPDRLASQCELARAYYVNGQVKEAVALLEEVVQIEAQVLAMDHPNRLTSERELARVYEANGQVKEAVALLEQVVQIQAQSLATDHPSRLASQQALASAYRANGQVKEAVALLEEVVQVEVQALAPGDPELVESQYDLAILHHKLGETTEAILLLEHLAVVGARSLSNAQLTQALHLTDLYNLEAGSGLQLRLCQLLEDRQTAAADDVNDTYSEVSDTASLATTDSLPSLTSSATDVADYGSNVQAAVKHFAGLLHEESDLKVLMREGLQKFGEEKFCYNNDRLLKAYFGDLREECATSQQKDAVRMLRGKKQRDEINAIIRDVFDPDRASRAEALDALLQKKPDRESRLEEFLTKEQNTLQSVQADVHNPKDSDRILSAGLESGLQLTVDQRSDDGDSDSSLSEQLAAEYPNLNRLEIFLTGGEALARYRANLHYLLRPPSSLAEVLKGANIHILERFLNKRFQELVTSDYEWLLELEETGYSRREMAEILMADARDSPWITFESQNIDPCQIQVDKHVSKCPHIFPGRTADGLSATVCDSTTKLANPESIRIIEQLCGLGGVIPRKEDDELWKSQVVFEDDFATSKISYEIWLDTETPRHIVWAMSQVLTRFCTAAALAQAEGICCDCFTVLASSCDVFDPGEGTNGILELRQIKLKLAVRLLQALEMMQVFDEIPFVKYSNCAYRAQDILGCPRNRPTSLSESLHYCALATQFLCVMFLSYIQGHVGPLDPFFLGAVQQKIVLLGSVSLGCRLSESIFLECALVELTCLGDMIRKPVLSFQICSGHRSAVRKNKYDVSASFDDFLDTWGPASLVYHRSHRDRILAIRIGGGYVFQQGNDRASLHWSTSMPHFPIKTYIPVEARLRIGAAVKVNPRCSLGEDCYREEYRGRLYQLGTHKGFYQPEERQVGVQAGQYINVSLNVTSKWVPPRPVKARILELDSDNPWLKLSADLKNTWGLQVSLCTGIARRVTLGELLADLLPKFTNPTKSPLWDSLQAKGVIDALHTGDLNNLLGKLDADLGNHLLDLIKYILNHLKSTGVDQQREHLVIAWPVLSDLDRCLKIRLNQQTLWARLLADSDQCATFACATTRCFVTDGPSGIQCRGWQPWENAGKLLGTAFSCQEPLQTNKSYHFRCCHTLLVIQVQRPSTGVPHLIVKRSIIPARIRKLVEKSDRAKTTQLIYERQSHQDLAEDVIVRAVETV